MKRERRNYWAEVAVEKPRTSWREVAGEAYLRAASERLGAAADEGVHRVCGSLTDARDAQ